MKIKSTYKNKKLFSSFFAVITCIFILLSVFSCELFTSNDIDEVLTEETNETSVSSDGKEGTFKIFVSPRFANTSRAATALRSADPNFDSELTGFEFFAVCTSVFGEEEGIYDSVNETITFTIASTSFSNKTIEFFIRDSSTHKELLYAKKENVNFTTGTNVEINTTL